MLRFILTVKSRFHSDDPLPILQDALFCLTLTITRSQKTLARLVEKLIAKRVIEIIIVIDRNFSYWVWFREFQVVLKITIIWYQPTTSV